MKSLSLVKLISIGIITGFVNGLLSVGGGTILIPAMVFLLGISEYQAHGTSLLIILPTTVVSCIVYGLNQDLDLHTAFLVAAGGIPGGYLGARLMRNIPALRLRQFFGVFMLLAGLRMLLG